MRINNCVHEIHYLTQDIKELDKIIVEADSGLITEDEARERMEETIVEYKKSVDKAKILLECFFKEEQKAGEPTDFLFRRLYSKLKEAY
jgi:hypothetical protein